MKKIEWFILMLVFTSMANAAQYTTGKARNLNTYIGAGVGTSIDNTLNKFFNETVISGKLFAGAAYNTYSALETSYAYLGSFANGQVKQDALALNAVGFVPLLDSLSLVVKGGVYYYSLNVSSTKTNGSDITYGLGLKYNFDYRNAIRGEWERYSNLSGSDIDMYTVSYSYRFGIQ